MKHFTLTLFLTLLLSMVGTKVSAVTVEIDGIKYSLDDTNLTAEVTKNGLVQYGQSEIIIPSTVTYSNQTYSVTSIGNFAFWDSSPLTSVTIPNSVTSIGSSAFYGCSGLTSINVEEGNIKYDSRNNCNAIIETQSNQLIIGCKNTIIPNSVTSIGGWAFYECPALTSVTIPNSVTSIESCAFFGCSGLTSITIPNSVTSIGEYAFSGCSGLTSIMVEEGNTTYDSRNSSNAIIETSSNILITGCMNTIIPNGVTSIGNDAFDGCSGLTSVTIPNSVTSIGDYAFYECSGLTSVTIPNSVTIIGESAFYGCSGLNKVIVKDIAAWCGVQFGNATSNPLYLAHHLYSDENTEIIELSIPNSVTSIGFYAFQNCSGLTSVTIPNSVTSIGYNAFRGCSGLTSVTIGNSVTSIENYAFSGCNSLTTVIAQMETPVNISSNVFPNRANATLFVPQGCVDAYKAADYWKEFKNIEEMGSSYKLGDANNDQAVDVADVVAIVNYILGEPNDPFVEAAADVNGDGKIDVDDVVAVVNIILDSGQQNAREMKLFLENCGFSF